MYNPTPSVTTLTDPTNILAQALTSPVFHPETRLWAGDAAQTNAIDGGAIVAQITSGPDAGKVGPYDVSATDGRNVAVGVLDRDINVGQLYAEDANGTKTAVDVPVTVFTGGRFIASQLPGLTPAVETDLGGSTDANGIFSF